MIEKKELELIKAEKNRELVRAWFLNYLNQPEILEKIDPEQYKKYKSKLNKIKNKGMERHKSGGGNKNKISEAFKTWKTYGFFDIKKIERERTGKGDSNYGYPTKKYRLNLEFFFTYSSQILPKEKQFNNFEKEFISFLFDFVEVRKITCQYENLFDGVLEVLQRIFLYQDSSEAESLIEQFAKMFFREPDNRNKIRKDKYFFRDVNEFLGILINKIKSFSKSTEIDYTPIWENEEIKKLKDVPFDIVMENLD